MIAKILDFIKSNLLVVLLSLVIVVLLIKNSSMKSEAVELRNKLAESSEIIKIKDGLYEKQALELSYIHIENKNLTDRIEQMDGTIVSYSRLLLEFKAKMDSINTIGFTKETTYVFLDSSKINVNSTDRVFEYSDKSLYFNGKYNTVDPFKLTINALKISYSLEFVLYQAKDMSWHYLMSSSDERLVPREINVLSRPQPDPWKYFIGGTVNFDGIKPIGFGALVGIEKGKHSVFVEGKAIDNGFFWGAGYKQSFKF